jgi:hypothetical protein
MKLKNRTLKIPLVSTQGVHNRHSSVLLTKFTVLFSTPLLQLCSIQSTSFETQAEGTQW